MHDFTKLKETNLRCQGTDTNLGIKKEWILSDAAQSLKYNLLFQDELWTIKLPRCKELDRDNWGMVSWHYFEILKYAMQPFK